MGVSSFQIESILDTIKLYGRVQQYAVSSVRARYDHNRIELMGKPCRQVQLTIMYYKSCEKSVLCNATRVPQPAGSCKLTRDSFVAETITADFQSILQKHCT